MATSVQTPPAGFTAVNGLRSPSGPGQPDHADTSVHVSDDHASTSRPTTSSAPYATHSWRPAESEAEHPRHDSHQHDSPISGKRKQASQSAVLVHDNAQLVEAGGDGRGSPKRRITNLDSAIDLTYPEPSRQTGPIDEDSDNSESGQLNPPGRSRRTESPVRHRSRGEPLPDPRPETEAYLLASVHDFQKHSRQVLEARKTSMPSPRENSIGPDTDGRRTSNSSRDDQPNEDNSDQRKRKRNFSNRTKTGCHTCRSRKKKCDEAKPACNNCARSGHTCLGYGPKPTDAAKMIVPARNNVPLQSKTPATPYDGRRSDADVQVEGGLSYTHWGRIPTVPPQGPGDLDKSRESAPVVHSDSRRTATEGSWRDAPDPTQEVPTYFSSRQLSHSHKQPPPPAQPPYSRDIRHTPSTFPYKMHYQGPTTHYRSDIAPQPRSSLPPQPVHLHVDPWGPPHMPYQQHHRPASLHSSKDSVHSGSHRSGPPFSLGSSGSPNPVEKEKMLRGQPFLHYLDPVLLQDRLDCKAAVERYNKAAETTSVITASKRGVMFEEILKPAKRRNVNVPESLPWGPVGTIGDHSIVESPFRCEYGYNIRIGEDCIIESGAYLQDAALLFIGNGVRIGHNVKLYSLTAAMGPRERKGSRGNLVAGAVKIEDDCIIESDVSVLPFVTIGRGAVVRAGSIVTEDVEGNTEVAGNPAKLVRRLDGPNAGLHHNPEVQRQQGAMQKWMVDYVNAGFNLCPSPRL